MAELCLKKPNRINLAYNEFEEVQSSIIQENGLVMNDFDVLNVRDIGFNKQF
jgi:hypothetical protein